MSKEALSANDEVRAWGFEFLSTFVLRHAGFSHRRLLVKIRSKTAFFHPLPFNFAPAEHTTNLTSPGVDQLSPTCQSPRILISDSNSTFDTTEKL